MKRADQLLADIQFGDAVTDHAFALQKALRAMGYESELYADNIHPFYQGRVRPAGEYVPGDLLIHHFAIGSEWNERIKTLPVRKKMLIYHNITPPEFFEGYNLHSQTLCLQAREQLASLSKTYDCSVGVSQYNCDELRELGFSNLRVLPILYDFSRLDGEEDDRFLRSFSERHNILFLGRIAPNKCQQDVIKAFYLFHRNCPDSRLFLAGSYQGMEKYLNELVSLVSLLGLSDSVTFTGRVSYAQMKALYRNSSLFLSMSEHEGFCVPLLESMHFDLPVLAFASSAIAETLGGGGVLCYEKNYPYLAELMELLCTDEAMRERVIRAQRERLAQLDEPTVTAQFQALIKEMKL